MKILFSKKAENGLKLILEHVIANFSFEQAQTVRNEILNSINKLSNFPDLGIKLANQADKRVLFVLGNAIVYQIVLTSEPYIVIRNIKPRKMK